MGRVINNTDVICEIKSDGDVIPMRFRILNDEGIYEDYTIRGYRRALRKDAYTTQDGLTVCNKDKVFECRIISDGNYRTVRLYFNKDNLKWRIGI